MIIIANKIMFKIKELIVLGMVAESMGEYLNVSLKIRSFFGCCENGA
jgi:hypothetical protein